MSQPDDSYRIRLTPPAEVIRRASARLAASRTAERTQLSASAQMKALQRLLKSGSAPQLMMRLMRRMSSEWSQPGGFLSFYPKDVNRSKKRQLSEKDKKDRKRLQARLEQWVQAMEIYVATERASHDHHSALASKPLLPLAPEEFIALFGTLFWMKSLLNQNTQELKAQGIEMDAKQEQAFERLVLTMAGVSHDEEVVKAQQPGRIAHITVLSQIAKVLGKDGDDTLLRPSQVRAIDRMATRSSEFVKAGYPIESASEEASTLASRHAAEAASGKFAGPFSETPGADNIVPFPGQSSKRSEDDDHRPNLR